MLFSSSIHEGLTFNYDQTKKIINFLNNNILIKNDIFCFGGATEEFALQSICINVSNKYYHIGNTCKTDDINNLRQDKFVYKISTQTYN